MSKSLIATSGKRNEFWYVVLGLASAYPAIAAGTVAGAVKAARGGSFSDGFENTLETVVETVADIGGEYGDEITSALKTLGISTVAIVLGGSIKDSIVKR